MFWGMALIDFSACAYASTFSEKCFPTDWNKNRILVFNISYSGFSFSTL